MLKEEGFKQEDTYQYSLTFPTGEICRITIIFTNGEFTRAAFPFQAPYSRDQWCAMVEIEKKISEIEHVINLEKCAKKTRSEN